MRKLMGIIRDRHGTYYAQQRITERLQAAVARVINSRKPRQVFLKRSLGTKVLKDANVRAKPVLSDFDRIIAEAEVFENSKPPLRPSLTDAEINRMAEYVYARDLEWDERIPHKPQWHRATAGPRARIGPIIGARFAVGPRGMRWLGG